MRINIMYKKLFYATAVVFMAAGVIFFDRSSIAQAAAGPAGVSVVANGATVSVSSKNAGALSCTSYPSLDGMCFYLGNWVTESPGISSDTFTITVTPPSGKVILGWNNPLCSSSSSTCVIKDSSETSGEEAVVMSFTDAPAPAPRTVTPAPTPTPTPAPDPTKPSLAEPVKELTFNGNVYLADQKPSVPEGVLVLGGKTFANAVVELTIHSTPRTATVTADGDGVWTYTVKDLEAGDHRVEAKVMDPATKKTSEVIELAKFSVMGTAVAQTAPPITTSETAKSSNPLLAILSISFIVLAVIVAGVVWYMRRKKKVATPAATPTTAETAAHSDDKDETFPRA
jgi:hypothetical protein